MDCLFYREPYKKQDKDKIYIRTLLKLRRTENKIGTLRIVWYFKAKSLFVLKFINAIFAYYSIQKYYNIAIVIKLISYDN